MLQICGLLEIELFSLRLRAVSGSLTCPLDVTLFAMHGRSRDSSWRIMRPCPVFDGSAAAGAAARVGKPSSRITSVFRLASQHASLAGYCFTHAPKVSPFSLITGPGDLCGRRYPQSHYLGQPGAAHASPAVISPI